MGYVERFETYRNYYGRVVKMTDHKIAEILASDDEFGGFVSVESTTLPEMQAEIDTEIDNASNNTGNVVGEVQGMTKN